MAPSTIPQPTANGTVPNGHTKTDHYSSVNGTKVNGAKDSYGSSSSTFTLGNFSVDEARPMKVVVIGAGYSGEFDSSAGA